MKTNNLIRWSAALGVSVTLLQAQATNEVELIKRQLRQSQEAFEKAVEQHRQVINGLFRRLEAVQASQGGVVTAAPPATARLSGTSPAVSGAAAAGKSPWSASQPITLARSGPAYMNISFGALVNAGWSTASDPSAQLNLGDHDPIQRGFLLRNAEIAFDGAVDPYFKGAANIVFKLDKDQGTGVELEEVFLQSTSLPANLQLKGGQFYAAFGRQNPQHPHAWGFVDQPLVLNRAFGPDGLRNIGGQLSWLAPTPFYSELFLGVFNGQSGQAFSFRNPGEPDAAGVDRFHGRMTTHRELRGPGDLLFVPRAASSFELTDQQTLVLGASAAFGPNDTGPGRRTQIYGADAYWKWKPARAHGGFPFVSWQTEALYRRFEAGEDLPAVMPLPAETLRDYGFYSQVMWGFKPRWIAGLRGEYVTGSTGAFDAMDIFRGDRSRVSPNLTWLISEFSKVRLQYNHDHGQYFGIAHSVWVQLEFSLGAHGAHPF